MRSGPLLLGRLFTSVTRPCCCFFVVRIAAQYDLRPIRSDGTHRFFAHELTVITDSQMSAIPESGRSGGSYIYEMTGRFRPGADVPDSGFYASQRFGQILGKLIGFLYVPNINAAGVGSPRQLKLPGGGDSSSRNLWCRLIPVSPSCASPQMCSLEMDRRSAGSCPACGLLWWRYRRACRFRRRRSIGFEDECRS